MHALVDVDAAAQGNTRNQGDTLQMLQKKTREACKTAMVSFLSRHMVTCSAASMLGVRGHRCLVRVGTCLHASNSLVCAVINAPPTSDQPQKTLHLLRQHCTDTSQATTNS
eukprot:1161263-Pelagomonas_calceolata.AAC.2